MGDLTLRPAVAEDAARLLAWRNDPEVRAASFSQDPVPVADHERWLASKLADPDVHLLIAELDARPLGQVRLDRLGPDEVEISVSLASEARGKGVGPQMLERAAEVARGEFGPSTLVARVRPENERSLRTFAAAGFTERDRAPDAVVLIRALVR